MADIIVPKKKQSGLNLQTAGMIGGMVLGGPAGAAAGSQIGGMLQGPPKQAPSPVDGGAMDRRKQELDQSPLMQIRDSVDSLQYIKDPAMRQQLAEPLLQASVAAKMKPRV